MLSLLSFDYEGRTRFIRKIQRMGGGLKQKLSSLKPIFGLFSLRARNKTLNIHHQNFVVEPMTVSVLISSNEELEVHALLQHGMFHGRLHLDHSDMDIHPWIVLLC